MYSNRLAEALVKDYLRAFRVVGIMGPRQSGKSTMIKHLLKNSYEYISFDYLEYRELLKNDPALFIKRYNSHVVFDEVQLVPELFQWIKITVDENPDDKGRFVLTGSGQFLLSKNISESLAGRIGLIALLPFQYSEIPVSFRENILIMEVILR
jgi:predicted AAA+ superfamily ATPase